ncbi:MAG: 1-acyl-sn-glycerol-3-phosphate acyltransferase [Oscillospiraceae bacterium]|nr:1-acyl-sn-glycerol-3-phosphate acyltransferase [Oscillospiraceae bacterium]
MNDVKKGKSSSYLFYDFVKATAALPGLIWFRPKILFANEKARERIRGGALLIANHIGFFDPVYLMIAVWYRRQHFVCLKQFFESSWGWFFRAVHCIPIDRENVGLDSVREIIRHLKNGDLVSMFPEGQINRADGELAGFKSGMVLMAAQSGKPVIPVYIRPKRRRFERLVMMIGEPVDVKAIAAGSGMAGIENAAKLLRQREEELKERIGRSVE